MAGTETSLHLFPGRNGRILFNPYGGVCSERYYEEPVGTAPFVEVPCEPSFQLTTGKFLGYWHNIHNIIGFVSPYVEILSEEATHELRADLQPVLAWEAAEMLGCSIRYLEKLRRQGEGPKFWRVAEDTFVYSVWYDRRDVEAYAEERRNRPERRGGRRERRQKV